MTLNLEMPQEADLRPRITVFGVGGAGCNAVNNMIAKELSGVDFVVANTDAQTLKLSNATNKIQLGEKVTEGLGAGAQPDVGARAAEESLDSIIDQLSGAHMCFITAGMGGGTGTGAAPIIAQAARELGILTVGVITKPFQFEGKKRQNQADDGVEALGEMVDTLIIIPNQNLFRIADEKTTFTDAFSMADDVLYQGVKGVTDLMMRPGHINLDFADIRVVMNEMGKAMMGTGESDEENRAVQAAEKAINNPLLDEISLDGARGVLINITGGTDLTLFEVDEAANLIRDRVDPNANILFGSARDDTLEGKMRVTIVATGIDAKHDVSDMPVPRRTLKAPLPLNADDPAPETQTIQPELAANMAQPATAENPAMGFDEAASLETGDYFQADIASQGEENLEDSFPFDIPEPAPAEVAAAASTADEAPFEQQQYHMPQAQPEPEQTNAAPMGAQPITNGVDEAYEPSLSPEVLQRLHEVVNKVPQDVSETSESGNQAPAAQGASQTGGKKSMFGNLIERVTGQAEPNGASSPYRLEPEMAQQPPQQAPMDSKFDEDNAIEVPAFLRRQAN